MPSPLNFLRSGPPPPKIALLPDALFFTRAVPIAENATAAEAAAQVELALEALSPFPLAQLYHGSFWAPGAAHAFVFAAYRRRFTSDQTLEWEGAELVLPAFAATFGANVEAATTIFLSSPEGLTAIHWNKPPVPSKVLFRPLALEATPEERARVRDELLQAFEGSKHVIELDAPLAPEPARSDREIVFRSGEFESGLPVATAAVLDVRDKGELAALRTARKRDLLLWRVALGSAAAFVLLGLGELGLIGGRAWQKIRQGQYDRQRPIVDQITKVQELTNKIEELSTKRLQPLEMVTQLVGENLERKPEDIIFLRIIADQARGLYTVVVEGRTTNPAQVNVYEATLRKLPGFEKVEAVLTGTQGNQARFTLTATFKPDVLNTRV